MRSHGCPASEQAARAFNSFGLGVFPRHPRLPTPQTYPPRVALFLQGQVSEDVFFLEQGLLKLLRLEPDGRELIAGLRATGWIVGAAAAILGTPYAVTAVTATPCRVARMAAGEFRSALSSDPALSLRVHEMHCREVYSQLVQMAHIANHSARKRLEDFLGQLAQSLPQTAADREIRLELPLKQWELAHLLAVTPQYLCQLLAEMEREGVLRREREGLHISGRLADSIRQIGSGAVNGRRALDVTAS